MKSSKIAKLNQRLSRGQSLVVAVAVLVSCMLFLLGYSLRKVEQITINVQTPGLMDVMPVGSSFVTKVTVHNPTLIPLTVLPFSLKLQDADSLTVAHLNSTESTKIALLSRTDIPLTVNLADGFHLTDLIKVITKGALIEGDVSASAFGIKHTVSIRKEYALSKLFKTNR